MFRIVILSLAAVFTGLTDLSAEVYPLKPQRIKITKKNSGIFPAHELRPNSAAPVTRAPKFCSEQRMFFSMALDAGDGKTIVFAVDEQKGTKKGFDLLYVDLEGTGDLARAKKLKGKPTPRNYSYDSTEFSDFEVELSSQAGVDGYPFQVRFYKRRDIPADGALFLRSLCVMRGTITLQDRAMNLVIFDADCNGRYGDKAPVTGRGSGGDLIWIGGGSPSLEEACMEAIPLGRYFQFEDSYYEITFSEDAQVGIEKAEVELGKIRLSSPGYILELRNNDGVLHVGSETTQEVVVPVGDYEVKTAGFRRNYKGDLWTLEGLHGSCKEKVSIKVDQVAELSVGPPLKIMIDTHISRDGTKLTVNLDFHLRGSAGEHYRYLRKNGKLIRNPEFTISTLKDRVIQRGKFEYG